MLFDTHCHLDYLIRGQDGEATPEPEARSLLLAALTHAESQGISQILTIATTLSRWDEVLTATRLAQEAKNQAEKVPKVLCSVGIHPHEAEKEGQGETAKHTLEAQIAQGGAQVAAIGESGLDYYYNHSPQPEQLASFKTHIDLAGQLELPLIVHSRNAEADTAACLEEGAKRWGDKLSGVLHCFTGGKDLMERALALGFYVSLSGIVTFKNADDLRALALEVPGDRLLIETDAPYLAPVPNRGQRNEPAFLRHTAEFLADLKGMDFNSFAELTTSNAQRLFTGFARA